jgi:hypothetical protein
MELAHVPPSRWPCSMEAIYMRGIAGAAEAMLCFGFIIIPLRITGKTDRDLRTVPRPAEANTIADEINSLSRQLWPAWHCGRFIIWQGINTHKPRAPVPPPVRMCRVAQRRHTAWQCRRSPARQRGREGKAQVTL